MSQPSGAWATRRTPSEGSDEERGNSSLPLAQLIGPKTGKASLISRFVRLLPGVAVSRCRIHFWFRFVTFSRYEFVLRDPCEISQYEFVAHGIRPAEISQNESVAHGIRPARSHSMISWRMEFVLRDLTV